MKRSQEVTAVAAIERQRHVAAVVESTIMMNVNPDLVRWHYIQAAFAANEGNVSATARQLSMHHRTLQRILAGKAPPERCAQHG